MECVLKKMISSVYGPESYYLCRICLTEDEENDFLSSEDQLNIQTELASSLVTLGDIFYKLTDLKIESSEIPDKFCSKCANQLLNFHIFRSKCIHQESNWLSTVEKLNQRISSIDMVMLNKTEEQQSIYLYTYDYVKPDNVRENVKFEWNDQENTPQHGHICNICKDGFQSKLLLSKHMNSHKYDAENSTICPLCDKALTSKQTLRDHLVLHERGAKSYECFICFKKFDYDRTMRTHIKQVHGKKTQSCRICPSKFASKPLLNAHMKQSHCKAYVCPQCGKSLGSKTLLKVHEDSHKDKICEQCGTIYKTTKSLKRHRLICEQLSALKDFKRSHLTPNPETHKLYGVDLKYTCDYCKTEYQQKTSLAYHIKKHHLYPGSYKCDFCEKTFNLNRNLKTHLKVHNREKTDQCKICSQFFVTKMALKYHMRLHSGEKPYKCTICEERFLSSSRRMHHMRKKHWGPQLECKICKKKYHYPYDLKKHLLRHDNPNSRLFQTIQLLGT